MLFPFQRVLCQLKCGAIEVLRRNRSPRGSSNRRNLLKPDHWLIGECSFSLLERDMHLLVFIFLLDLNNEFTSKKFNVNGRDRGQCGSIDHVLLVAFPRRNLVILNSNVCDDLFRWSELTRKIELWVEIQELNDQGEYTPVEVSVTNNNILTGGIYHLRQGQQRRIQISVKPVQNSGTLPIICDSITSIAVGSIINR